MNLFNEPRFLLDDSTNSHWLGLMIGNSRLHWAEFEGVKLLETWDTKHLTFEENRETVLDSELINLPIILASVVPEQTQFWQHYPNVEVITLEQIPLKNLYPTLGIDRALAVLGGGIKFGFPILVIDAGTALTFTGCDRNHCLVGGAILPGLGLQFSSLATGTSALPQTHFPEDIPQRWARETPGAIHSGIIYSLLAGIRDFIQAWCQDFPESKIVFTGGDAQILVTYLKVQFPFMDTQIVVDPTVIFEGMLRVKKISQT